MRVHSVLLRRARGYRSQHATAFISSTHHHVFMMCSTPSLSGVSFARIHSRDFSSKSNPKVASMMAANTPFDSSQQL
eukprot:scaffold227785_cov20-Cyclotella_meneghiniana.AAC.1